jgi:Na+-translocating ferredoxin:NAD+ oxidoreductase subunit B
MHTVIAELCTGCDLCVPPCPVDCIDMIDVTGNATGWDAWSQPQADAARERHDRRMARDERERIEAEARANARKASIEAAKATEAVEQKPEAPGDAEAKKRAIIQAAMERARKKKEEMAQQGAGPKNTDNVSAAVQAQIDAAEARRARLGLKNSEGKDKNEP